MVVFVIGGSGSGKSEYAEGVIMGFGRCKRYYIATMQAYDDEARAKIRRHREMRKDKGFDTIECQKGLPLVDIEPGSDVLLECISNLAANEMFDPAGAGPDTVTSVMAGVDRLADMCLNLVIVSNNIFGDGADYSPETSEYIGKVAEINGKIAERADKVVEVVYGIPLVNEKRAGL